MTSHLKLRRKVMSVQKLGKQRFDELLQRAAAFGHPGAQQGSLPGIQGEGGEDVGVGLRLDAARLLRLMQPAMRRVHPA